MSRADNEQVFDEARQELDERGNQDDAFWLAQRRAIRRRVVAEQASESRSKRRTELRAIWAWSGVATAAVLLLVLVAGPRHWQTWTLDPDAASTTSTGSTLSNPAAIDPATAELLRSVEITLASDVAPPLSAADLLLARMEEEYAASLGTRDPTGTSAANSKSTSDTETRSNP